jgi:hypothetical protein
MFFVFEIRYLIAEILKRYSIIFWRPILPVILKIEKAVIIICFKWKRIVFIN